MSPKLLEAEKAKRQVKVEQIAQTAVTNQPRAKEDSQMLDLRVGETPLAWTFRWQLTV